MPQYYAPAQTVFQPKMSLIASISQSAQAVVTTTANHNLISGTIVRIVVPPGYGMPEINGQVSSIVVLTDTTFMTGINSTNYQAYVIPAANPQIPTTGQVIPLGENNSQLTAAVRNILNPQTL